MTITSNLRQSVLMLMAAALVAVTFVAQMAVSFITEALHDSKGVRVAASASCSVTEDGAHFTGCSSIL